MIIRLTRALDFKPIDIAWSPGMALTDGPHGGAVIWLQGQKVGVVETREQILAMVGGCHE